MTEEHRDTPLSDLERDVLLASSGELPWWRRSFLHLRLRSHPQARGLRRTLDGLQAATGTPKRHPFAIPMAAAACASLVLLVAAFLLRSEPPTDGQPSALHTTPADETTAELEPLHLAATRLLIASAHLDELSTPASSPPIERDAFRWWPRIPASAALSVGLDETR